LKESESNCLLIGGSGRNSPHSFAASLLHSSSKKSMIKQVLSRKVTTTQQKHTQANTCLC